jgi:hypothetical protein
MSEHYVGFGSGRTIVRKRVGSEVKSSHTPELPAIDPLGSRHPTAFDHLVELGDSNSEILGRRLPTD